MLLFSAPYLVLVKRTLQASAVLPNSSTMAIPLQHTCATCIWHRAVQALSNFVKFPSGQHRLEACYSATAMIVSL